MGAFTGPGGNLDAWLVGYALGCASCFGISHISSIHLGMLHAFPRTYGIVNPILPAGRALFLLAFLQRGVENQERELLSAMQKHET
jgi:TRAP-type C4-dicarboxylate transport system permease small subunit